MSHVHKGKKRPYPNKVLKFINQFPDLFYNGAVIKCKVCEIDLLCWDKRDCRRHVNSVQHTNRKYGLSPTTQFMIDLLLVLIACNIPLHVLDKPRFREFWNKYNPQKLPCRSTLRRYIPVVCEDTVNKIICVLKNTRLWLCVNETTDCKKHSIINIIVRVLDPRKPTMPLLLASKRLIECTGETITRVVLETLEKFELSISQVLMLVTDGAAAMRVVGRSLQEHGCSLLHVTCKAHALHLVAETIRQVFPEVDILISSTEEVFRKSPKRLRVFHSKCPGIPEPPQPILTRWGTWLKAAFYYAAYFPQIKAVVLQFNPSEAAVITESQTHFGDSSVETALQTIQKNYTPVHDAIEKLENSALSLAASLQVVDEVNRELHAINDPRNERVRERFTRLLNEDTGFTRLRQMCDGASSDPLSAFKDYFKYACITSIDVERSFSKYNHIYSPLRTSFTETTMETYLMLQSFYQVSPVCDNNQATSAS